MSNNKMNVRRGDRVEVISGNYKGARGQVLRAIPRKRQVVVEGVAVRKRHQRPSPQNPEGGILSFEAPISVSNVMLICPHCDAPARVRRQRDADGTVERLCKRCSSPVPTA
jgi:large subunit ribosomal protein L24